MSNTMIVFIALVAAILVGRRKYTGVKSGNTKNKAFAQRAIEHGWVATGRAVKVDTFYGDRSSSNADLRNRRVMVAYEFQVDGKTYYKHMSYQNKGMVTVDYPKTITIYYDPKNIKASISEAEVNQSVRADTGCLQAGGKGLLVFVLVVVILNMLFGK